jgi:membrane protease YdiL (CAAX protease family)
MTIGAAFPGLAVGPLAGVAVFLLLAGARLPRARPRPLGSLLVVRWLILAVEAGLEELIWRGIAMSALLDTVAPPVALVVTSAGFALWHWPHVGRRSAIHLLTGMAFGAAFLASGLAAAMLAHALYNVLVDWAVHAERARVQRS